MLTNGTATEAAYKPQNQTYGRSGIPRAAGQVVLTNGTATVNDMVATTIFFCVGAACADKRHCDERYGSYDHLFFR